MVQPYIATVRAFRWADLEQVAWMLAEAEAQDKAGYICTVSGLREWLGQPNLRPEEDFLVADLGGWVIGWIQFVRELPIGRTVATGVVHPKYRRQGVGRMLLQAAMSKAYYLGASVLHVAVGPESLSSQRLLVGYGFIRSHVQRVLRLADLGRLVLPALGWGVAYRALRQGEEAALTELQNAAFSKSWGFNPNTVDEIAYRLRMTGCSHEGARLVVRDDVPVAYCWTGILGVGESRRGVVWMIGVHPRYRGLGFGRAALAAGVSYLKEQGVACVDLTVDEDNTSAVRLYHSSSFNEIGQVWWYEWRRTA
ncbi:MAG: GNAT family N-acetyltransferase [Chloroflexi bacterium]|nr:GNAT family N-acetyltransferase [Chloroflexota bacterium]